MNSDKELSKILKKNGISSRDTIEIKKAIKNYQLELSSSKESSVKGDNSSKIKLLNTTKRSLERNKTILQNEIDKIEVSKNKLMNGDEDVTTRRVKRKNSSKKMRELKNIKNKLDAESPFKRKLRNRKLGKSVKEDTKEVRKAKIVKQY